MASKSLLALLLSLSVGFQVCSGATVEEARGVLNDLRSKTNNGLSQAFSDIVSIADEVDQTAAETRSDGLKELEDAFEIFNRQLKNLDIPDDVRNCLIKNITFWHLNSVQELFSCVNNATAGALDFVHDASVNLVADALKVIVEDEKRVVYCGSADEKCLDSVAADAQDDAEFAGGNIRMTISVIRYTVKEKESFIQNCVRFGIQNDVEFMKSVLETPTSCV